MSTNPLMSSTPNGVSVWRPAAMAILAYAVAMALGLRLLAPGHTAALWWGNGILAAGLLVSPARTRLPLLALCCCVNLGEALLTGLPLVRVLTFMPANMLQSWLIASLTRALLRKNFNLADGRRLAKFLLGVILPATLLAVLPLLAALGLRGSPAVEATARNWALGSAIGDALVMPAILVIANRRRFTAFNRPLTEFCAAMAVLGLATMALFWSQSSTSLLFLVFPMLMLVAFRYGPLGASVGSLMVSLVAAVFITAGLDHVGLSAATTLQRKIEWIQFFVSTMFLTTLPAAGGVASYARMRNLLARRTSIARIARRRADAAAAAKSEFLANMSHEIRTPLNGVMGLADALSRTELAPSQRDLLKMILVSGKALNGLLSDALDLARADSGALKLSSEPFDVREAIGASAYLFQTIAREKGLEFTVRFDIAPPGAAVGDPLRIKQVISNLISNAVKFTTSGSVSVDVSLHACDDDRAMLTVLVKDTGPGFGPEVKARLFNRFEQGDGSVTRRYGGSGLGLAIVHRLADMMGAEIDCDSTPGVGSWFRFTAPLSCCALGSEPAPVLPMLVPRDALKPIRILLAEDHLINQKVIQAMLDGATVDMTIVSDGQAAVHRAEVQAFDVILMDTHMPVMDGLAAIRAIRDREAATGRPRTPIISLTADAMPQQVRAAEAAGADLHLAKPITADGLIAALNASLRLDDVAFPQVVSGVA